MKLNNITEKEALRNHRQETALGNFRKCISCKANYLESAVILVDEEEEEFSYLKELPDLRRMSKFSICVICQNTRENGEAGMIGDQEFGSKMICHQVGDGHIYSLKIEDEDEVDLGVGDNGQLFDEDAGNLKKMVMFPSNISCLNDGNNVVAKPRELSLAVALYKCEEFTINDCGILYFNQISKYRNIVNYNKRFTGDIQDQDNRVLSNLQQCPDDSQIRGSDKWLEHQSENLKKRFVQLGQSAFRVEMKMPKDNVETIATDLLIDGVSLTVSFEGDDSNETETKYLVHLGHTSSSLCTEECETMTLQEYLQTRNLVIGGTRSISSYLTSVFIKVQSFVKNIVKCHSSELFSEEYSFSLTFDSEGVCYVIGFLWPETVLNFNEADSLESYFGDSLEAARETHLNYVAKVVTCTSNESELRKFGFNKNEAKRIVNLVKKHQIFPRTDCPNTELPSLQLMFKHSPSVQTMRNIEEAERLKKEIRKLLVDLQDDELNDLSTEDWLQDLSTWSVEILDNNEDDKIRFSLHEKTFTFMLDQKLLNLIVDCDDTFIGVYQYAISCVADEEQDKEIILKRPYLLDIFTHPYNPFFLQAMMSTTVVTPVYGYSSSPSLHKCADFLPENVVHPQISATHRQMSLVEAFSLSDARKFRDVSSSPDVFCNTNPDAKQGFTRVANYTENSFAAVGEKGFFELNFNTVSRHNLRMNGQTLLLAETSVHFEFVGSKESEQLFSLYRNKLEEIPKTETIGVVGDEKMPDLILCSNGQVLKKRKTMKILNFPTYEPGSTKFKYSRILLFYPLPPGTQVSDDDIERFFNEKNDDQPVDKYNQRLTIIENLERKFYKRVLYSK